MLLGETLDVKRLLVLSLLALALPGAAHAQVPRVLAGEGESLSLSNGRGVAIAVARDGAMLGTVTRGRIVISDLPRGDRTSIEVSGCERRRRVTRRTVACTGRDLSFSVIDGRWRATITGTGINASAVLEGAVTIKGTRGTYKLGEAEPRRWPRRARTLQLG
jgi:hypothetical protein